MLRIGNHSDEFSGQNGLSGPLPISVRPAFGLTAVDLLTEDFAHQESCACYCCAAQQGRKDYDPETYQAAYSQNDGADIPGDTSTAATIAIGQSVTDELEVAGDTDWFRITLAAGDSIAIALSGSGANPVSDTYLRLYDANGNLVAENDDSGGSLNSFLRFVSESGGTYYIEADSYANNKLGEYTLSVTEAQPLELFDYDQIADQLTSVYWGGSSRAFALGADRVLTYDVSSLPDDARNLAVQALLLWGDVTGIQFVAVEGSAQITFQDTDEGAYASSSRSGSTILSSLVNVSAQWLVRYGVTLDSYSFQTYVHEIGHALGLGHAGNYNGGASYGNDAAYLNDAWSTTVMSYFDQSENQYFRDLGFSRASVTTPMLGDIAAMEQLYGLSTTTRPGDTTYGFNSTADRDVFDATRFPDTAYTIVDSGGIDTLDYSGFTANQRINLNPETFSDIGGRIGTVSIGRGTIIENAIGGSGSDTILGNDSDNRLLGNAGADTLLGAGGDDILRGGPGADELRGGIGNDLLSGDAGADRLYGSDGNDFLAGGGGNDLLVGGDGDDIFFFDTVGQSTVDQIDDFVSGEDRIQLDRATGFEGIGLLGLLSGSAFHIGSAAADADDRIIYDDRTGDLWFDPDGTGSAAAQKFATVEPGTLIAAEDFQIVDSSGAADEPSNVVGMVQFDNTLFV